MQISSVAFVGFKFRHHGNYSGYQQLVEHMEGAYYLNRDNFDFSSKAFDYPLLSFINSILHRICNWFFFYKLKSICHDSKYTVIHFLYPENTLAFCPFQIPANKIVIATFHQPLDFFHNLTSKIDGKSSILNNFRRCDKAILLTSSMLNDFKAYTQIREVKCIPHGVDIMRFAPSTNLRKKKSILFVGNWLRDFSCASKVFRHLSGLDSEIQFIIISNKKNLLQFLGLSNAILLSDVSDDYLLNLFQTSTLLFLPLLGATANNAILEAASCGLPIVVTYSDATAEYFPHDSCEFFPIEKHSDIQWLAAKLQSILNSSERLSDLSISGRANAERFSWENISCLTKELYS